MVGKQEIRCKWGGVGGRTIGTVLPEGSCPKSRVTWEPGWDNKGGRWEVGRMRKHEVSRLGHEPSCPFSQRGPKHLGIFSLQMGP